MHQGEDIVQSDPNERGVLEALERLDLLVVQELFLSETARYAHLVLPAAGYLEQDGTFTIAEHLCIAWRGTSCSTCRERCPVEGAITVAAGRPTIDATACTACGECVAVCPAPILAIRFTATRPA